MAYRKVRKYGRRRRGVGGGPPRYNKRRRQTRARASPRTTLTNFRNTTPYAQRYITKLKYSENYQPGSVAYSIFRFRINSLYDPNYTGGGHQPYGFDQLSAVYNRYRVISCSYAITIASSVNYLNCCVVPTNDVPAPTTMAQAKEMPRARWATGGGGTNVIRLKGKCYIPSLFGRTRAQYMADDRYQSLTTLDPNEAAILNIILADCNDTSAMSGVAVSVTLVFTAELFDYNILPQSTI